MVDLNKACEENIMPWEIEAFAAYSIVYDNDCASETSMYSGDESDVIEAQKSIITCVILAGVVSLIIRISFTRHDGHRFAYSVLSWWLRLNSLCLSARRSCRTSFSAPA